MCEVKDWTKPVEIVYTDGDIKPVEVLWHDERYPNDVLITWGDKQCAVLVRCITGSCYLRNTPPPPPEVWIVWQKEGTRWRYFSTYRESIQGLREGFYQQKVTCDAPLR